MRPIAASLSLDEQGFELHTRATGFGDFYDEAAVLEGLTGEPGGHSTVNKT